MKKLMWFALLFLAACAPATPATPDAGMVETAIAQTQAAVPTETLTPVPTETIDPFELTKQANQTQNAAYQATSNAQATLFALTPSKTPTPRPTNTRVPTATPTFTPLVLTGTGDAIVDVELPENFIGLAHITGNAASRHFAVSNLDANNDQIDLLVNTTDPYDGIRPIDFRSDEHTVRFEVSASGEWTIEVIPLGLIRRVDVPGTVTGMGDDVIALIGDPDTAIVVGNADGHHFAITGYGGQQIDLLVNTTDPYNGTVLLDPDTLILEIKAEGEWTIEITAR